MLWDASQQRVTRESRDRLTELYVGVRDGYVAAEVMVGRVKWTGGDGTPTYARSERAPARGLAQLMRDFPGNVLPGTEFVQ